MRTYYVATANSVYGGHPVTPERLAKAVEAMAEAPLCDYHCVSDGSVYGDCSVCNEFALRAALAVLAGEE